MHRITSRCRLASVTLLLGLFGALAGSSPAVARTDFDFSLPTDGASVGEPVSQITVGFTDAVTLVGAGFEVLDPQGNILQPFAVTDDDRIFRLQLDPPLAGGAVGVRWEVAAQDGQVLSGSFSFRVSVEAAPVTSAPAPVTTAAPAAPSTTPTVATTPDTVAEVVTMEDATAEDLTAAGAGTGSSVPEAPGGAAGDAAAVGATPGDDGDSSGIFVAVAAAIAIGAGAFVVVRSRRT